MYSNYLAQTCTTYTFQFYKSKYGQNFQSIHLYKILKDLTKKCTKQNQTDPNTLGN